MSDHENLIDTYLAAYGEPDESTRATLIAEVFAADATLADPPFSAHGHDELSTTFGTVQGHYPGHRFARTHPLILSANLSFDQSYDEVEGDSASAAELYALMSAIAGLPIRQGIAVTGAINQEGSILPVGGVTDKIEGFFAACERKGLDGNQGVIIPRRNADNVLLRDNVRDAVANGLFRVWTIDRFEHGWPILTGREAGEEIEPGKFTEDSAYDMVARRLDEWAEFAGQMHG